jgi:hypothetical protein
MAAAAILKLAEYALIQPNTQQLLRNLTPI